MFNTWWAMLTLGFRHLSVILHEVGWVKGISVKGVIIIFIIYLTTPGLSYSMQDFFSLLWHVWSFFGCDMWELAPWPRIKPRPPELKAQSLSYWLPGKSLPFIYFSAVLPPVPFCHTVKLLHHFKLFVPKYPIFYKFSQSWENFSTS